MVRCIDCQKLPWRPEADLSFLPPMRCDPQLPPYRWRPEMLTLERECPHFVPKSVVQAEPDHAAASPADPVPLADQGSGNTSGPAEVPARPEPSKDKSGERPNKPGGPKKPVPKKGKGGR